MSMSPARGDRTATLRCQGLDLFRPFGALLFMRITIGGLRPRLNAVGPLGLSRFRVPGSRFRFWLLAEASMPPGFAFGYAVASPATGYRLLLPRRAFDILLFVDCPVDQRIGQDVLFAAHVPEAARLEARGQTLPCL